LAYAFLFALIVVIGVSRAHSVSQALIILGVLGAPLILYLIHAFRRRPMLILDDATFTDGKSGDVVLWENVFEVHLRQRQGVFGVYHHLVFTIRREAPSTEVDSDKLITSRVPPQTLRVPIDQLSMGWSDIVGLVQERLGKPIAVKHEAGLFGKTRISS